MMTTAKEVQRQYVYRDLKVGVVDRVPTEISRVKARPGERLAECVTGRVKEWPSDEKLA